MGDNAHTAGCPKVSFIIPTLNRGLYVSRAVESCLRNASDSVQLEVVVIDSSSDDGSFENLEATYGNDTRVRLLQNGRSSGPLKSWLEGVEAATGDYMTFVWSDDVISPRFLGALLPPLQAGAVLSYGAGMPANVDSSVIFPEEIPAAELSDRHTLLKRYYRVQSFRSVPKVVSPVCSLFDGKIVRDWMQQVERFCHATALREHLMWRSAIGPDLMLYLSALTPGKPQVAVVRTYTAQLSEHPGSITTSSNDWILKTGYWLARLWYLEEFHRTEQREVVREYWGSTFMTGCFLLLTAPLSSQSRRLSFGVIGELKSLLYMAWRGGFLISGFGGAAVVGFRRVMKSIRKKMGRTHY